MRATRKWRSFRFVSLLAVLAVIAAACGTGGGQADTTTTSAAPETTTTTAATTTTTVVGECPTAFCVRYNIHQDAAWADGTPVTAEDFAFTFETIMNPDNDILSREGYDKIEDYEIVDDKTIVFHYSEIFAPWQTLFSAIIPKHEMEGQDFNTYWDDIITLGSGPFQMVEWVKDQRITLERNPNYWASQGIDGQPLGDVQRVEIVFLEDSQTQIQALRGREIHMFYPQPQLALVEEVSQIDGVEFEAGLGPIWEHIDFNQDDSRLQQEFVRKAIGMAIDRESIVDALIRPLAPDAVVLNNTIWMANSVYYEDHLSDIIPFDPAAAAALLEENGCTRGSDGIFECNGERLSFTWTTTAGNEARELQFEIAQATLAEAGIEVTAKFGPAAEVFADENFYGGADQWQIFNFAWVGSPDPFGGNTLYYCEGDAPNGFGAINNLRYCDPEVEELIRQTDTIVDPDERAATYNEADRLFLAKVPMIPLYQKPTFFAWDAQIQGPKDNATQIGPFWNIETWTGLDTVVFGADQQPESMNTFTPDGNLFAAGLVATAVLQGAYTVTPDFQYVPQLIESAEAIVPAE